MLVYVLSVDNPRHNIFRCYHRAAHEALGLERSRLADRQRSLRVVYVLDDDVKRARTPVLRDELLRHTDVLLLPNSHTCLGKIIACFRHAAATLAKSAGGGVAAVDDSFGSFDSFMISDDDAFFHPTRLLADVAEVAAPNLFYGQISWAGYWDVARQIHVGYANNEEAVVNLLQKWKRLRHSQGPYPFANGFAMVLGPRVITAILTALDREPILSLRRHLNKSSTTRKCTPQGDAGAGYLLAQTRVPIKWVDTTSGARIHFWRAKRTGQQLEQSLVLMHGAQRWEEHFKWGACILAKLKPLAGEFAPKLVCRRDGGSGRYVSKCATRRTRLLRGECNEFFARYSDEGNHTWCTIDHLAGHGRRCSTLTRADTRVCDAPPPSQCRAALAEFEMLSNASTRGAKGLRPRGRGRP